MALVNCKQCGKQVSTDAKFCPHCGAVNFADTWSPRGILISIIFIVVFAIIIYSSVNINNTLDTTPKPASSVKKAEPIKVNKPAPKPQPVLSQKDLELQKKRVDFIDELKKENVIHKIEKLAKYPHVFVAPVFYTLSFEQKSQVSNIIFTYYITDDPEADILLLYDYFNGKEIGTFTKAGLKLK